MDGFGTPYGNRPGLAANSGMTSPGGYGGFGGSSGHSGEAFAHAISGGYGASASMKSPSHFARFSPTGSVDRQRAHDMQNLQQRLSDMQDTISLAADAFNSKAEGQALGLMAPPLSMRSGRSGSSPSATDSSFANGGTGGAHPRGVIRHSTSHAHHNYHSHYVHASEATIDFSKCKRTEGKMTKKGGERSFAQARPWLERYCRLENNGLDLVWYEKATGATSKTPKDKFTITSTTEVETNNDKEHKNKSVKFDFTVKDANDPNNSRSLYCDTEQEANDWIATIEYIVEMCNEAEARAAAAAAASGGEHAEEASLEANLYQIDSMLLNLEQNVAMQEAAVASYVSPDVAAFMSTPDPAEIERLRDEAQCHTAYGPGLYEAIRGEPSTFLIQACDASGDPKHDGGDIFLVTIESEEHSDLKWDFVPIDNGDGTYSVEYTPTRVGEWTLRVLFGGEHDIYGSPFYPIVSPAPTSASHCLIRGAGAATARVGSVNSFNIVTRDIYDDERRIGGDSFEITILGPGLANPIVDNGDGTYTVSYDIDTDAPAFKAATLVKPPTLELHIALNNPGFPYPRLIKDSPFCPRVEMIPPRPAPAPPVPTSTINSGASNAAPPPPPPPPAAATGSTGGAPPPPPPPPPPAPAAPVATVAATAAVQPEPVTTQQQAPPSPPALPLPLVPAPAPPSPPLAAVVEAVVLAPPPPPALPPAPPAAPIVPIALAPPQPMLRPEDDPEVMRLRAELGAKEKEIREAMAAMEEQRLRLEEERRKVDEDNRQVTEKMARLRDVSTKVKEISERNIEQARAMQAVKTQLAVAANANAAAAASAAAAHHSHSPNNNNNTVPTPSQPDFERENNNNNNNNNNNAAGISPGTAYTRQTYQTYGYDDGASIYTNNMANEYPGGAMYDQAPAAMMMMNNNNNNNNSSSDAAASTLPSSTPVASSSSSSAAYTTNQGAIPRALMSMESPGELFDPEVMALFDKHRSAVRDLWAFYTAVSRGADGARGTATGLDVKRFITLLQDYDICPTFVTKKELKQIFIASSRAHGGDGAANTTESNDASLPPLTYAAFVEALGRTALVALAKPAFITLYPHALDKVKVLLEMWGIADVRKLRDIQDAFRDGHGPGATGGSRSAAPGSVSGKSRAASVATGTSGRKSASKRTQ